MTSRLDVVNQARTWLDTPFHHQARLKGVGVDCIGVVIGVARELGLVDPAFDVKGYKREPDGRSLLNLAREYMVERASGPLELGCVVAVAFGLDPQHFGIVAPYRNGGHSIIHAYSLAEPPRVIETRLMFGSHMRLVAAFDLPGVA